MLDNTRLRGELAHIHRTLSGVAASPRGKGLVDHLRREVDGTSAAMLWQSLFADCLRVAYTAAAADGVIGEGEIGALYEFVFSVARHYAGVLPAYRDFTAIDEESIRQFLERYAADSGPFGERATLHWPGLTLCRRAADLGETEALERYERMMSWLIPVACEIGGVTEADPRWSGRVAELHGLRRTLASTAGGIKKPTVDPRVQAFLAPTGVFAAVQQASSVFETDPFDVEKIHQEARTSFEQMVERASSPVEHSGRGRMLLVLGESGAGKTHLLRGFRRHVHEYGRGFVAYAQMQSASVNYARYLLHHVVDSLTKPYTGPSGEQTGLVELASGLSRLVGDPLRSELLELAQGNWDELEGQIYLSDHVNRLVDNLLQRPELSRFDPDLLRVLLYALYPDQATTARVYKYLRCEDMNPHDRASLGNVVPRNREDDPVQMIRDIARLAHLTRKATLVLMIDQAELSGYDSASVGVVFRRAIDALQSIVSEVPSAIAVVACLSDLYEKVRADLGQAMLDRLEKDPGVERLHLRRSYPEIEAVVGRRLSWLFAQTGVAYRPEEPVYPIPVPALRELINRRTRDVLQWCHQFQVQCATAKKLIDPTGVETTPPDIITAGPDHDLHQIANAWNDASHASGIEVPVEETKILEVLGIAAKAVADELGLALTRRLPKSGGLRVQLSGKTQAEFSIAVTNANYHGGKFGLQIETLRKAAKDTTPVAVRTVEFPRGAASEKAVAQLLKNGGRRAYLDEATLRTIVALHSFRPEFPADRVLAWRQRDRPISTLAPIVEMFDIDRLSGATTVEAVVAESVVSGTTKTPPTGVPIALASAEATDKSAGNGKPKRGRPRAEANGNAEANGARTAAGSVAPVPRAPAMPLNIGTASTFGAEPRTIELDSLLRHTGILGSPGSGKTTLALNLIEQALERDIAVVLVDRKGDLAGYAKPEWWRHTADPERARKLAERVDVRLFTPGTRGGRPLSLSVIPDLQQIPDHERDRMVQYSANALAAMMRLGDSANDHACRAMLTQAIAVLAGRKLPSGLPELVELLATRDDQLLARVARFDDRLFDRLVQALETVRLSDADLFDPAAEPLTAETLIGRKPDGKVPLAIASTRFLGDVERIQSWVAHLIGCLNRHAAQSPSAALHTLFMIDEADLFMPAGASKPPSKEPLQDLLKRARAAGLGVVLASQSPADFDYRSREQINTWFLGRIAEKRSIEKMKPLFEQRPAVGSKLATLEAGRFVMLQDGGAADLDRTPSLLRTEQLSEAELMTLAALNRERAPVAAPASSRVSRRAQHDQA